MATVRPDTRLGSQIWVEENDDRERINFLVERAASLGFGQVRIFLMWPWIQNQSSRLWDFTVFDHVFEAAAKHGVRVKATLTANSPPWWLGTPSVLHNHTLSLRLDWREPARAYIDACVSRYASHPALSQWILWNEPFYAYRPRHLKGVRPEAAITAWPLILEGRYEGDLKKLNHRWRSGFASFSEVPFPEDLADQAHSESFWQSFGPVIDDYYLRARLLNDELDQIRADIRVIDQDTPICINPNQTLMNHAQYGYDFAGLAAGVDVLGASFHAPWSFGFARRDDYSGLVIAGLSLLQKIPGDHSVEVTELQTGNTFYAGMQPGGVNADDVAVSYLAPLLAGAQSVTGWCLNTRRQDFEAGEWGLLDDDDGIGERARAVAAVQEALVALDEAIGAWLPIPSTASVLVSERSQLVRLAIAESSRNAYGCDAATETQGGALLVTALNRLGVRAALEPSSALRDDYTSQLLIISDMLAWDEQFVDQVLSAAHRGATVMIDGTSGEFDFDATLHRPWPGFLRSLAGLQSKGLLTQPAGDTSIGVRLHGEAFGSVAGVRSAHSLSHEWTVCGDLTYEDDAMPVLWQRSWGGGRLLYTTASLSTSILREGGSRQVIAHILHEACRSITDRCRPLSAKTFLLRVRGQKNDAIGVFRSSESGHTIGPIAFTAPPGRYVDLWTGKDHVVDASGIVSIDTKGGLALLVRTGQLDEA